MVQVGAPRGGGEGVCCLFEFEFGGSLADRVNQQAHHLSCPPHRWSLPLPWLPAPVHLPPARFADACTQSPASNPQTIAVASSTQQDAISYFSNIGPCVGIFAPGSFILSAGIASDASSAIMSGTSMASPHTAGAVAIALQAMPTASVAEVTTALLNASANIVFSTATAPRFLQVGSGCRGGGRGGGVPAAHQQLNLPCFQCCACCGWR